MSNAIAILLATMAGLALGSLFFGGLWWTTGRAVTSQHVSLWTWSSLLLRISIILTGFYFVSGSHWERFAGCLFGFVAAREIATVLIKRLRQRYGFVPSQANRLALRQPKRASGREEPVDLRGSSKRPSRSRVLARSILRLGRRPE